MAASTGSQGACCVWTQDNKEYPCLYDVSSPSLVTSPRYLGGEIGGEILWCAHTGRNAVCETPDDRNTHRQRSKPPGSQPELFPRGTNPFATVKLRPTSTNDRSAPHLYR